MSAPRAAGYSLTGRDKVTPEDRWAVAELDRVTLAAVADGVSDPLGTGQPGASGAVADAAVAAFVERGSRLVEAGETDPARIVNDAFTAALSAAERRSGHHPAGGGAALVGACFTADGALAIAKVGDCRARVLTAAGAWADATPGDDADRSGALTRFAGRPETSCPAVVSHEGARAVLLLTDGAWRQRPEPPDDAAERLPFPIVRDLITRARRLGEGDDLTAVLVVRPREPRLTFESRLSPAFLVVAAVLFVLAGWLLSALAPARAADPGRQRVHHILVLDDSGSMETDFDVHGFGLAVPQLYRRILGPRAESDLAVLLLAQRVPFGSVPRLRPDQFLTYPRENGTFYARAIDEAIALAAASSAPRVVISLVTDAEPNDSGARRAVDQALAANPRLSFSCFQLGTADAGDLCAGRSAFARDGFELAQVLTEHLAKTLGSVPRWGRLDPRALRETELPLSRFVSTLHVFALGGRAGEDFEAEVLRGREATPLTLDRTRPMMDPEELTLHSRRGPRQASELPVGASPRLTLGTLSLSAASPGSPPTPARLRLVRADGPVAWGVIVEYELEVTATTNDKIASDDDKLTVRAELTHRGIRIGADGQADLLAMELTPRLTLVADCDGAAGCPGPAEVTGTLTDGGATFTVPADLRARRFEVTVRFTSDTAHLEAPPLHVVREAPGGTALSTLPPTPPTPPTPLGPAPTTAPPTVAAPPPTDPAPAAPPVSPTISRWVPPTLDLPEHLIERTELGYALTVTTHDGRALTGPEITAEGLSATLVWGGARLPMALVGDRFEVRVPVGVAAPEGTPKEAWLELQTPTGRLESNRDTTTVLPDQRPTLGPRHAFEDVPAGCEPTDHCQPLALGGARLDAPLEVHRATPGPLTVALRRGDERWLLSERPISLTPSPTPLEVCVAPPGCATLDPDELTIALTVRPADPRLQTPDREATTQVVATVVPSPWITCNLWWILLILAILLTLFIAWGYLKPRSFSAGAILQVADQERRLAKDPGRPLRSLPHGRKGFYRTASCALDASGFTVRKSRPHTLALVADPHGIALVPRGAIERKVRGRWVPVDRQVERHVLPGAIYRVNQAFVFRVLA